MSGHCKHCGYDGCLCDDRPSCHRCNGFLEPDGTCANFYCPNFTFKTNMNEKTESDTPIFNKFEINAAKRASGLRACAIGILKNPDVEFAAVVMNHAADKIEELERERDEARKTARQYHSILRHECLKPEFIGIKLPWE